MPSKTPPAEKATVHRKPDAERRDDRIPVRVTAQQKAMLVEGARRSSVEVSTWLRSLAIRECRLLGITEESVTVAAAKPEPTPEAPPTGERSPKPPKKKGRG